ncbi:hypothetical protein BN1232_04050 [Mycobacterium lentiflavum]|uniref:Transmembrane protein n=1 Tax=Mycobacterium lentiflavum TaxID=141349 RepID=A0A0E4GZL5_MYCLN|nr:hypothetical protein [Mycobacterium lentiflavum]CQD17903.1 hypothetical protein BN1232_04050 [Mycobacterium lentiflavum]
MTPGIQKTMALSGALFVLTLFPAMLMIGLLPPISPMRNADEVAHFWSTNTGLKRLGLVLLLAASGLQVPFGALIAVRIRQMEGGKYSALAYAELVGVGLAVMAIIMPTFFFAAASYRPERNPEITQALNDLGWLPFIMNWPPALIQCLAIGFAIFGAKHEVWPRWLGYFNVWCAFIFCAGGLAVLFKNGVFAWNGLLAFWMAAVFFGVWFLVMTWQLWVSIGNSEQSPATSALSDDERLRGQLQR